MSGTDAVVGSQSDTGHPRERDRCHACGCDPIQCASCIATEIGQSAERLRGAIRARPLIAVVAATGAGVLAARFIAGRDRLTGARQ